MNSGSCMRRLLVALLFFGALIAVQPDAAMAQNQAPPEASPTGGAVPGSATWAFLRTLKSGARSARAISGTVSIPDKNAAGS